MRAVSDILVIFDCDGVLVDSEPIALSVLGEMLQGQQVALSEEEIADRFLGRSLGAVAETVQREFGVCLPGDFPAMIRRRLFTRYERELQAMPGIQLALEGLAARGVATCVASSSLPERIEKSLLVTGLSGAFGPRVFSASMVKAGKPAPDLFLHAARQCGFLPANCIVVEDSPAGIQAARAAGMHVLAFGGGGHARSPAFRQKITALKPDAWFDAMPELLQFVDRWGSAEDSRHG
ncbi:haloacid dehalogenase superfamily, subfamily IA, variant 3 with third motif having DD or ED [Ensifer adhaerens]|nr:haloacid dehalogenase superfamily, subfamily IA, variant 3 with third motif having DD or ED [Ensifer adhaerens]